MPEEVYQHLEHLSTSSTPLLVSGEGRGKGWEGRGVSWWVEGGEERGGEGKKGGVSGKMKGRQ